MVGPILPFVSFCRCHHLMINNKGVFGFLISITHNSKMVGPMMETSYKGCLDFDFSCFQFLFPSLNSLIFE